MSHIFRVLRLFLLFAVAVVASYKHAMHVTYANVMVTKPPMKTPKGCCTCPDLTCLVGDPYKPLIATVAGSYRAGGTWDWAANAVANLPAPLLNFVVLKQNDLFRVGWMCCKTFVGGRKLRRSLWSNKYNGKQGRIFVVAHHHPTGWCLNPKGVCLMARLLSILAPPWRVQVCCLVLGCASWWANEQQGGGLSINQQSSFILKLIPPSSMGIRKKIPSNSPTRISWLECQPRPHTWWRDFLRYHFGTKPQHLNMFHMFLSWNSGPLLVFTKKKVCNRGFFYTFFIFTWGNDSIWRSHFSKGLVTTTKIQRVEFFQGNAGGPP